MYERSTRIVGLLPASPASWNHVGDCWDLYCLRLLLEHLSMVSRLIWMLAFSVVCAGVSGMPVGNGVLAGGHGRLLAHCLSLPDHQPVISLKAKAMPPASASFAKLVWGRMMRILASEMATGANGSRSSHGKIRGLVDDQGIAGRSDAKAFHLLAKSVVSTPYGTSSSLDHRVDWLATYLKS